MYYCEGWFPPLVLMAYLSFPTIFPVFLLCLPSAYTSSFFASLFRRNSTWTIIVSSSRCKQGFGETHLHHYGGHSAVWPLLGNKKSSSTFLPPESAFKNHLIQWTHLSTEQDKVQKPISAVMNLGACLIFNINFSSFVSIWAKQGPCEPNKGL